MEQMQVPEEMIVHLDFSAPELPKSASILSPVVFQDGDSYCCLLGKDPSVGIFGCASTPLGAVLDWENALNQRLQSAQANDKLAQYAKDMLAVNRKDIW
jgi:hypothetical protein